MVRNGYKKFGPDWMPKVVALTGLVLAAIAVSWWVLYAFGGRS